MTQNLIKTRKDHKALRTIINEDNGGGGNGGGTVDWSDVTGKPAVIAAGADQAAARQAIGAGTSNVTVGTGATNAKPGNYQPTAANISDATAVGRSVLTAADQAAARTAIGAGTSSLVLGAGATQAASGSELAALAARVTALENAAGG